MNILEYLLARKDDEFYVRNITGEQWALLLGITKYKHIYYDDVIQRDGNNLQKVNVEEMFVSTLYLVSSEVDCRLKLYICNEQSIAFCKSAEL